MILEDLYYYSMECEISKHDFFHSTLEEIRKRIEIYIKKKEKEVEQLEHFAWRIGTFVIPAIGCCFNKKITYPKDPVYLAQKKKEEEYLTEEQKKKGREKLLISLQIMQANFEMNHDKESSQ